MPSHKNPGQGVWGSHVQKGMQPDLACLAWVCKSQMNHHVQSLKAVREERSVLTGRKVVWVRSKSARCLKADASEALSESN